MMFPLKTSEMLKDLALGILAWGMIFAICTGALYVALNKLIPVEVLR